MWSKTKKDLKGFVFTKNLVWNPDLHQQRSHYGHGLLSALKMITHVEYCAHHWFDQQSKSGISAPKQSDTSTKLHHQLYEESYTCYDGVFNLVDGERQRKEKKRLIKATSEIKEMPWNSRQHNRRKGKTRYYSSLVQ